MKNRAKNDGLTGRLVALALVLFMALPCPLSRAADKEDPFDVDGGGWMSFSHYQDADERGIITDAEKKAADEERAEAEAAAKEKAVNKEKAAAEEAKENAAIAAAKEEREKALAAEAAAKAPAAPVDTVRAKLQRAVDLPVMPGLNKGFDLHINTTEDYRPPAVPVINPATPPDIHLSEEDWQSFSEAQNGEKHAPLNVRLSFLPGGNFTPLPSQEPKSGLEEGRTTLENAIAEQNKPTPKAVAAACAAIDAYKKQQLDAIESDRQTLKALQDAIKSLGLEKQLGFIAGEDSSLSSPKMDMPVSVDAVASPPTTVQ